MELDLKNDTIIPYFEMINTLQGASRKINIPVDEFDFDYKYTHEPPFPVTISETQKVEDNFNLVFDKICNFSK